MLALWASIASVQLASPSYASSSAVTWSVDRSAKIITVTVNLTFTGRHLSASASQNELLTFQQRVTDIEARIKAVWDGQRFKCYTLRVVINSRVLQSSSGTTGDESPITLLHTRTPSVRRAFFGGRNSNPLSEDPGDAYEPTTGSLNGSSTWPLVAPASTYGYLFGRLLGLDSTFDRTTRQAVTGAADDVMTGGRSAVSPSTMTRLIRRSGLKESELTCPLSADLASGTYIYAFFFVVQLGGHFWTCDYDPPSSLPAAGKTATFTGTLHTSGQADFIILPAVSASGDAAAAGTWVAGDPQITFTAGSLIIQQGVAWTEAGVIPVGTAILLGGGGALPIAGRFDFKDGAPECP